MKLSCMFFTSLACMAVMASSAVASALPTLNSVDKTNDNLTNAGAILGKPPAPTTDLIFMSSNLLTLRGGPPDDTIVLAPAANDNQMTVDTTTRRIAGRRHGADTADPPFALAA